MRNEALTARREKHPLASSQPEEATAHSSLARTQWQGSEGTTKQPGPTWTAVAREDANECNLKDVNRKGDLKDGQ